MNFLWRGFVVMMNITKNNAYINLKNISIIEAPSILGLKPTGTELLPDSLKRANLLGQLSAENVGRIETLSYNSLRDKETLILNPQAIYNYSLRLAEAVTSILRDNKFPLVLGGDCSILIGNLLAKKIGKVRTFFH